VGFETMLSALQATHRQRVMLRGLMFLALAVCVLRHFATFSSRWPGFGDAAANSMALLFVRADPLLKGTRLLYLRTCIFRDCARASFGRTMIGWPGLGDTVAKCMVLIFVRTGRKSSSLIAV
jgi:hypothetical protein